jgi:hypothetical protein
MRKIIILCSLLVAGNAFAQEVELPSLSPHAKISQTIGLTEMTVEYSSPAVRGRPIWGTLVPYNELWRAGANMAAKLTASKDFTIGTTLVPAGTYSIFVIPQKTAAWTFIINKDFNQGGTSSYKKELDVVRIDVKPEVIPAREHLAYTFPTFTNDQGVIALEWEKVRLPLTFKLATDAQVTANIQKLQDDSWRPLNSAARYELEQKKDIEMSMKLVDQSIGRKETWFNVWTKAQIFAAKKDMKEAHALATKAQQLGEQKPDGFFFADEVKAAVRDWKPKS